MKKLYQNKWFQIAAAAIVGLVCGIVVASTWMGPHKIEDTKTQAKTSDLSKENSGSDVDVRLEGDISIHRVSSNEKDIAKDTKKDTKKNTKKTTEITTPDGTKTKITEETDESSTEEAKERAKEKAKSAEDSRLILTLQSEVKTWESKYNLLQQEYLKTTHTETKPTHKTMVAVSAGYYIPGFWGQQATTGFAGNIMLQIDLKRRLTEHFWAGLWLNSSYAAGGSAAWSF